MLVEITGIYTDFNETGINKAKISGCDSGKDCYIVTYYDYYTREYNLDVILKSSNSMNSFFITIKICQIRLLHG